MPATLARSLGILIVVGSFAVAGQNTVLSAQVTRPQQQTTTAAPQHAKSKSTHKKSHNKSKKHKKQSKPSGSAPTAPSGTRTTTK